MLWAIIIIAPEIPGGRGHVGNTVTVVVLKHGGKKSMC